MVSTQSANRYWPRGQIDWTWVSLSVYLALVGAWARLSISRLGDVVVPYVALHYIPSALIFAGGLLAYARVRGAWQKALALQVALLLSPGTGDLVSRVFWSTPFEAMHGQPVPAPTTLAVYAGFALPWLLLMFAPGIVLWLGRAIRLGRAAPQAAEAAGIAMTPAVDWGLVTGWTLATLLGWVAMLLPAMALLWPVLLPMPGVLQWLVLRRRVAEAGLWIVASAAGMLLSTYLATSRLLLDLYLGGHDRLDSLLTYSTFGATLGLAQWLVLRRWSRPALAWILANMLAWPAGWALSAALGGALNWPWLSGVEPAAMAVVAGAVTGLVLARLLPAAQRD